MVTPEAGVDLKVDGKYFITMTMPDGTDSHTAFGQFKEIVRPTKIVFTWSWEHASDWAQASLVTVLLKELDPNKTELQLIHELLPNETEVEHHGEGWSAILESLTHS